MIYKIIITIGIAVIGFAASLLFGAAEIDFQSVWLALTSSNQTDEITIIRELRIPRVVAAMFVGASLSVAGSIMQGLTRNPLADPGLLGLTAGANLALAITIAFIPSANYFTIMLACFFGAAIGALLVFGIGFMKKGGFSPFRIVLAGAAVTALLTAISDAIGIYFKIAKDVSMWTSGGLIGTTWKQLLIIIPVIVIGIIVAILFSRQLTILSLNENVAVGLGQKTRQIKAVLFVAIILLTGAAVALVGNMVFIGLMIPHIVRAMVGTDYRFIIPFSAMVGATFMMLADLAGRTINAPYETPVAAIVAILGLPFFLIVIHRGGKVFS